MAYNLTLNNQQMQLSLARTGGQGTKGDSVSSVTMNGNGDLIVVITDAAGNQVSSTNVGGSAYITATQNIYDQFDDRYLGDKSSAPTVDNDGNALLTGALYFDTTTNNLGVYNGSSWEYPVVEAQTAQTSAETAKTAAELAKTNAETAETNAAASATTASTQATNSANSAAASLTSANNSATSATASAGSATAAASSASTASTQATNAATSATNAATSETNSANSATAANTSATNAANSATNAATSESNAATSETNASNSASAASSSANAASTSEGNASASASAAAVSETNAAASQSSAGSSATAAAGSATNAATSASNAAASLASVETLYDNFDDRFLGNKSSDPATDNDGNALVVGTFYYNTTTNELKVYSGSSWVAPSTSASNSASAAATSATSAANSATAAAGSETAAATSATNAANSASAAATSATNASNSESAASTSETNAATSATNAATSETNASNSATAAATSASNASTSETNAATSATNAANSASAAATSASNASTSESNAATSETNAATSATNASNSASAASTSETNAATSATAAQTAQTAAETALDNFDDRYLGVKSSDPTVDNDGDALVSGALYFNSGGGSLKVYDGTQWNPTAATTEAIQDLVGALLVAGNGIDLNYDDAANSLTITSEGSEQTATNNSGSTIAKGTPVYQSGTSGQTIEITPAQAGSSSTMPAIGIVTADIANGATGVVSIGGRIQNLDTSSYSDGDTLYVGASGSLIASPPTGEGSLIQNIAKVVKSNASSGSIIVTGAGRSNATPNLNDGNFFLGNGSNQSVATDFDTAVEANSKVAGIEANADVTDTANVTSAGALMKTGGTMTGNLILNADPSAALGATTKQYVDTIASAGIHYHSPVRAEHPSNLNATYNNGSSGVGATLTNAGTNAALVIDSVSMVLNDRVLVANQTDQTQNGVYTVTTVGDGSTAWVLTRSTDTDTAAPSDPDAFGKGDAFFIKEGSTNAGHLDVLSTAGTIIFGTTNIVFSEVAETSIYSAGDSLTLTGTLFDTIQDIRTSASPTFAGTTINGNITVTGTVDGRDVANDGTKLDGIESGATADQTASEIKTAYEGNSNTNAFTDALLTKLNGIEASADVTDTTNVTAAGALMTTGGSVTGNVSFGDNNKAIFGAGSDLQIYHSGSQSFVQENGTGQLVLDTQNGARVKLTANNGTENMVVANKDGDVELYYDNALKLATTSTGIDVTGTVTADAASLNNDAASFSISSADLSRYQRFRRNASNSLILDKYNGSTTTNTAKFDENGDISFYEDTGTTPKFFWDASAESLGIGTSSPSYPLHVSGTGDKVMAVTAGASSIAALNLGNSTNLADGGIRYDNSADALILRASNAEKMRIDSSGNLLVGKTSADFGATAGVEFRGDGRIATGRAGESAIFNRLTTDGDIALFRKNGTTVGSIGTLADDLSIGNLDTGLVFQGAGDRISPFNPATNTYRDAAIDLGASTRRFKDLHLSGTANVGGIVKSTANTVTASGATTTIDMTASNFHVITMNASTTFSLSNLASAITSSGTIVIKQDATGSRNFTLPSSCKTPVGGATITQYTGANSTSVLSYLVVSSTEVLVNYIGNFA